MKNKENSNSSNVGVGVGVGVVGRGGSLQKGVGGGRWCFGIFSYSYFFGIGAFIECYI